MKEQAECQSQSAEALALLFSNSLPNGCGFFRDFGAVSRTISHITAHSYHSYFRTGREVAVQVWFDKP